MITRRELLRLSLASGLVSFGPRLSLASAPGDNRFVFVMLRGGMDGLDMVQPYGDPRLAELRPGLAATPADGLIDLDGFFGLSPKLRDLAKLWSARELAFVHAVSSPYRSRSHFEAQDTLENGTGSATGAHDGWLNRFLSLLSDRRFDTAVDLMPNASLVMSGPNKVDRWLPNADLKLDAEMEYFLTRLYQGHSDFEDALQKAKLSEAEDIDGPARRGRTVTGGYAKLAAKMLRNRARIAAISVQGWDSHQNQEGLLRRPTRELADGILTLKEELGPVWRKTTLVAVSEFGRTARINGTGGTDHGTGGLMLIAGGAINGGRMAGPRWPGLGEGQLYEDRDLLPGDDVRRYLAWLLKASYGVRDADLTSAVFPGLDMGSDPRLV